MILITGASRGIGKFLFEKYVEYNDVRVAGTFCKTHCDEKYRMNFSPIDINNFTQVYIWVNTICETMIRLLDDKLILLNCAGINYNAMAHKSQFQKWSDVVETNLIGTFNVIHQVLPIMRQNNYGRIINFGSVMAKAGVPGTSAYAASKSGLLGMTKAIATENGNKGITINTINLGYFNIGMIGEVPGEQQEKIKAKIPCGKFGDPEQIWNTVNYIVNNDYLNGAEIDLNGGIV